jgi:hypothetical protein
MFTTRRFAAVLSLVAGLSAATASAQLPTFGFEQLYSSADGAVQFIVLRESTGNDGQHAFANLTLTARDERGATRTYRFPHNLPGPDTSRQAVLIGSIGFAALGRIAPDFVMPDRFLPVDGGIVAFANSGVVYESLPTDGVQARVPISIGPNVATNFAGGSVSLSTAPITVVEFHHAALDHYFISPLAPDIEALDGGRLPGWSRTGRTFAAWPTAETNPAPGTNPVCRYYIPPAKGDSHFFSASPAECADVARRVLDDPAFAGVVQETPGAFRIALPDVATGACPAGTLPVYRLWNRRSDSNHRYTTDRALRDQMIARGYAPEGYGPLGVAMCAPDTGSEGFVKVSDTTPYAPGCAPLNGTLYANAEVEPYLAINPRNPDNLIGVWQQDRWSNGAARGNVTGISFDGGRTWEKRVVPFSRCGGGNAANNGDFDRATDPWVTFSPDGTAHQIALALTGGTLVVGSVNGVSVSRSTDGGRTWSNPHLLIVDGPQFFNDKEAMTADPSDARFVYASWDRLRATGGGPSFFARTVDGGLTWEPAREIHDPGTTSQTINNIPVVLPNGTLYNFFSRIDVVQGRNVLTLQLMRSPDKGVTWEAPVTIGAQQSIGVFDPENLTPVRDAAILGSIAVSRTGELAVVWQDARFSGGVRDAVAFSRSSDGGRTWTTPVRVSRDPNVQAFIPTVGWRDDGTIGVTYYDFRSNTADPGELGTDYWLATSTDGITWRETRVAGPFDFSIAANARGLFVGDYMALGTRGSEFVPFFGITNNGNVDNRSDIAIAFVGPGAPFVAAKREEARDDPMMYRAESARPLAMSGALSQRHDHAIRAAMQWRVSGWQSPARPRPEAAGER